MAASPSTGNTHPRHFRMLMDGIDLSGDARNVGSFGLTFPEVDVSGWSDGVLNYLLGTPSIFVEGWQAVFNNTANTGSHVELSAEEEYIVSLLMGIRGIPEYGSPAFAAPLSQSSYTVEGTDPLLASISLNGAGVAETLPDRVWGLVVYPSTSISATTTGTSVDFGAAQANGAHLFLHVTVADGGGTWTLKVRDSSNDSTFADYTTFTADGQTVLAEINVETSSMDRYVLFEATDGGAATGATFTVIVVPQ